MGATGWDVQLQVAPATDVTEQHSFLRYLNNRAGVSADSSMAPWTADGRSICLIPTGRDSPHSPVVYEVESERIHRPEVEGWSLRVQAAPAGDKVLVPRIGGFEILAQGRSVRSLTWDHPEQDWPHSGWLGSGQSWFAVGRRPYGDTSWIWFLDLEGNVVSKERLDPFDVEPFDRDAYAEVTGSRYSLKWPNGSRSVGTQLSRWIDARYDPSRNLLLLATARPVDAPFRERDFDGSEGMVCHVETRWFSVTLHE